MEYPTYSKPTSGRAGGGVPETFQGRLGGPRASAAATSRIQRIFTAWGAVSEAVRAIVVPGQLLACTVTNPTTLKPRSVPFQRPSQLISFSYDAAHMQVFTGVAQRAFEVIAERALCAVSKLLYIRMPMIGFFETQNLSLRHFVVDGPASAIPCTLWT